MQSVTAILLALLMWISLVGCTAVSQSDGLSTTVTEPSTTESTTTAEVTTAKKPTAMKSTTAKKSTTTESATTTTEPATTESATTTEGTTAKKPTATKSTTAKKSTTTESTTTTGSTTAKKPTATKSTTTKKTTTESVSAKPTTTTKKETTTTEEAKGPLTLALEQYHGKGRLYKDTTVDKPNCSLKLTANVILRQIDLISINVDTLQPDKVLHTMPVLKKGESQYILAYINDTVPDRGISCTDIKGRTYYYAIRFSGKDGSVYLQEIKVTH